MSASDPNDPTVAWRGVKQEIDEERDTSMGLRAPSRRLLADLLRPWRWWIALLVVVVVAEALARLVIPLLVQRVLDDGLTGDRSLLYRSLAWMAVAIVVQIVGRVVFLRRSGRIGNEILLELRRRLFRKFQQLDPTFHDRYTSGRAVSDAGDGSDVPTAFVAVTTKLYSTLLVSPSSVQVVDAHCLE